MLDCIITVKGKIKSNGDAQQGCVKNNKSGPVYMFIKDMSSYYDAIYKHCLVCDKCDPNKVLSLFLANRDTPTPNRKSTGTSGLLIKMANRYVKNVKGTDPDWLRRYVLKSEFTRDVVDHLDILSKEDIVQYVFNTDNRIGYEQVQGDWIQLNQYMTDDEFMKRTAMWLKRLMLAPTHQNWANIHDIPKFVEAHISREISAVLEKDPNSLAPERTFIVKAIGNMACSGAPLDDLEEIRRLLHVAACMFT